MTFSDWLVKANATYGPHTGQRYGQWLWNSLDRDDILVPLAGSSMDPFYRDDLVPAFLMEVARRW
jgi:hypothetical protein